MILQSWLRILRHCHDFAMNFYQFCFICGEFLAFSISCVRPLEVGKLQLGYPGVMDCMYWLTDTCVGMCCICWLFYSVFFCYITRSIRCVRYVHLTLEQSLRMYCKFGHVSRKISLNIFVFSELTSEFLLATYVVASLFMLFLPQ